MKSKAYSVSERRSEKQASREKDDAEISSGKKTVDEVSRQNGLFSGLDLSKAKVRRRGLLK
jgi:hypothetical protein